MLKDILLKPHNLLSKPLKDLNRCINFENVDDFNTKELELNQEFFKMSIYEDVQTDGLTTENV